MRNISIDWTLVIALWGAVLSTVLAIREFTKDRVRVRVTCEPGKRKRMPLVSLDSYPTETYDTIVITVLNSGHRQADIVRLCLDLGGAILDHTDVSANSRVDLPKSLVAGESLQVEYYVFALEETLNYERERVAAPTLKIKRIFAKDATGQTWACKPPQILIAAGLAE